MEMCTEFWAWLKCKKASIFVDLWWGAFPAVCGFPSTLFDLFLESNVMIVANFEIWKHTCCVSLPSSLCTVLTGTFKLLFYSFEILDSFDEILYEPLTELCLISSEVPGGFHCVNRLHQSIKEIVWRIGKYTSFAFLPGAWWKDIWYLCIWNLSWEAVNLT